MAYDNTNRGTLGRNKRKEKESHPEYAGQINIDGKDYWLSGWVKEGNDGKFFSLSVRPKDAKPSDNQRQSKTPNQERAGDFEDDIPF